MPACYGELHMTGQEIADCTPYELELRAKGYQRRITNQKLFVASLVTVPFINYGGRGVKRPVTVKKLFPDDFKRDVSKEQKEELLTLMEETERNRKNGES